jgi:hypothetical protein
MNRITSVFLVLAAMSLVAAKTQNPEAIVWSNGVGELVVPDESAVLAKFVATPNICLLRKHGRLQ